MQKTKSEQNTTRQSPGRGLVSLLFFKYIVFQTCPENEVYKLIAWKLLLEGTMHALMIKMTDSQNDPFCNLNLAPRFKSSRTLFR